MTASTKPLVIYHGNCPDGFCAAWVTARALGDVELFAGKYGDAPPLELAAGRPVYVVDFSYPRVELERLCEKAMEEVLLDHHRTAANDLALLHEELCQLHRVPLAGGKYAIVDACDVERVSNYSWSAAAHGGAVAYAGGGRANAKLIYMHRMITDAPEGSLVDHRNRNTLDNRRANLRLATRTQNAANMDRGSRWKGIRKCRERWAAQITLKGENRYLGTFDSPEEAAKAYDTAARELFGEFALLNFDDRNKLAPANLKLIFDMNRSGAGMVWDFFHPDEPRPWIVDYVEDRDLWRFALPNSEMVSLRIRLEPHELEAYDALAQWSLESVTTEALGAKRYLDHYVKDVHRNLYHVDALNRLVAVNCAYTGVSDVLNEALKVTGADIALGWHLDADGKLACSLRSKPGVDCSDLAKSFGGGGHAQAAGFSLSIDHPFAYRLIHNVKRWEVSP
jgi:hypothetical protein